MVAFEVFTLGLSALGSAGSPGAVRCDLSKHSTEAAELQAIQVRRAAGRAPIEVRVRESSAPVVLLLSSLRPVTWQVMQGRNAPVQRVILVGARSKIRGLGRGTRTSHCGRADHFQPYSSATIDRVADALELSVGGEQRNRVARTKGYEVRRRAYPNLQPDNPWDRCRVDFDYAGDQITRDNIATPEACRAFCDVWGRANTRNGRTVCVFDGTKLKAYPAATRVVSQTCRLLTPSGRNISSFRAVSEAECRERLCYVTGYLWTAKPRHASQCRFQGRTLERKGM